MIINALAKYYDILAEDEDSDIALPGFSEIKVSYALNLSGKGHLLNIIPLEISNGTRNMPRMMMVPEQFKRAGTKPYPYFLCDKAEYMLGLAKTNAGQKEKNKAEEKFNAFKKMNCEILKKSETEEGNAVIDFLNTWNCIDAAENPIVAEYKDAIEKNGNLVFKIEGKNSFVHQNKKIQEVWLAIQNAADDDENSLCIITGEKTPIARVHPAISGLYGGQTMGNTLIGFQKGAGAYESYGKKDSQGFNSPVGKSTVFAYGTVLNKLLSNNESKMHFGDTTMIFWAETSSDAYRDAFAIIMDPGELHETSGNQRDPVAIKEIRGILEKISDGEMVKDNSLFDDTVQFHILGLSPNAARISIRFYMENSFGYFIKNIQQHYSDIKIERQYESETVIIPPWKILKETVAPTSKDKSASPVLSGSLMRAILNGQEYPRSLYESIMIRIRADKKINYIKSSIIKGYFLRYCKAENCKEVLQVSLNESSVNKSYLLGRLFAVLEKTQKDANPNINATIKDRYFNSACGTPGNVFPVLLKLSNHHISKAEYGYINENRIKTILDKLEADKEPFPKRLSLDEQGLFILGYYHQMNALYKKKEDN